MGEAAKFPLKTTLEARSTFLAGGKEPCPNTPGTCEPKFCWRDWASTPSIAPWMATAGRALPTSLLSVSSTLCHSEDTVLWSHSSPPKYPQIGLCLPWSGFCSPTLQRLFVLSTPSMGVNKHTGCEVGLLGQKSWPCRVGTSVSMDTYRTGHSRLWE